jgi:hypothetical protein
MGSSVSYTGPSGYSAQHLSTAQCQWHQNLVLSAVTNVNIPLQVFPSRT